MSYLPENGGWEEGVSMIAPHWPVTGGPVSVDEEGNPTAGHSNLPLQQLANRTRYLYENMSSGGGIPDAPEDGVPYVRKDAEWVEMPTPQSPVKRTEWIQGGTGPEDGIHQIGSLEEGGTYILQVSGELYAMIVIDTTPDSEIPVGSEYHFICAGPPENVLFVDSSELNIPQDPIPPEVV